MAGEPVKPAAAAGSPAADGPPHAGPAADGPPHAGPAASAGAPAPAAGRALPEPVELELKFALDAAAIERLRAAGLTADGAQRSVLRSVYWDTPEGELAGARLALRVRRTASGWVQTVKGEGEAPFARFEWEAAVASETPERAALPSAHDPRGAVVHRAFDRLAPLFATEFERLAWRLRPAPSLTVELAADTGRIEAGGHAAPIAELEAERIAGSALVFHRWALRFATRHGLRLTYPTKSERGLRLAARLPDAAEAVKAEAVAPPAESSAAQAASRVVRACVAHFTANVAPVQAGEAPEPVHQARVALRRLRAALKFFELPAREPGWQRVDALARKLADILGRLRDADVLAAGLLAELQAAMPQDAALAAASAGLARYREQERAAVRAAVAGRDATRLVLAALYLSERLTRTVRGRRGPDDLRATPFGAFAAHRLDALAARLRKRARRAAASSQADAWHQVRIAAKNVRYALEFASQALPARKRVRRALRRLAALQQHLGAAQDGAVASATATRTLSGRADTATVVRTAALVDGWVARTRASRHDAQARRAQRLARRIDRDLRKVLARAPGLPETTAPADAPAQPALPQPASEEQPAGSPTSTSSPITRT